MYADIAQPLGQVGHHRPSRARQGDPDRRSQLGRAHRQETGQDRQEARALIAKATPMSKIPISTPATAGPTIRAALKIAELRATALPMSSRPTISMTKAWRVGMSIALVQPRMNAIRITCQTWISWVSVRTARTTASPIAIVWVAMRVRRLGRLSATMPPNRPKTSTGANCAAVTTPSQNGSPVNVRTSQSSAMFCIQVPTREMSWPDQKILKLRWRRALRPSRRTNLRTGLIDRWVARPSLLRRGRSGRAPPRPRGPRRPRPRSRPGAP